MCLRTGELLLYARANPAARGQRFVQVTRSRDLGRTWAPFALVEIAGYDRRDGELYFFSVQPNPVHADSLLALFPVVHRHRGCIGVAVSLDGRRWSPMLPLLPCATSWDTLKASALTAPCRGPTNLCPASRAQLDERKGERTHDHPAAGLVRRGGDILLYVHERVPDVADNGLRHALRAAIVGRAAAARALRPRLVRYTIPAHALLHWTRHSLRQLKLGGATHADAANASELKRKTRRGRSDHRHFREVPMLGVY